MLLELAAALARSLAAWATNANGLNGGDILLFTNVLPLTPATLLTDLTEATFPGYARVSLVTWSAAYVTPSGLQAEIVSPAAVFTCTGGAGGQDVTGYAILDKAGLLVAAENFDVPQSMHNNGETISVTAKLRRKDQGF